MCAQCKLQLNYDAPRSDRGWIYKMNAPTFFGMPTCEGLGLTHQIQIINVTMTLRELVDTFPIHAANDDSDQLQRKLTSSRAKKIKQYLLEREDAVFPQLAGFVTSHTLVEDVHSLFRQVIIPDIAERMLVDGQGRREGGMLAMEEKPELGDMTIDMKLMVLKTDTLLGSAHIIRQVFSDYHKNVVKPNSSINLFFDSSKKSSAFYVSALEKLEARDSLFAKQVSRDGSTNRLYTLAQFKVFLEKLTGMTDKQMEITFEDEAVRDMWLRIVDEYARQVETNAFPDVFNGISTTEDVKTFKKSHLACCAIGIEALGRVGNLIIDSAIAKQQKPDLSLISGLSDLDMDRNADIWQGKVMLDGRILKGSAKKLATKFAFHLELGLTEKFLEI